MRIPTWLSFFIFLFPLSVLPLLFSDAVVHGLAKLHLSQDTAVLLVFGMLAGGFINLPIKSIARGEVVAHHPLAVIGLSELWPGWKRLRKQTIIALNVGGGLIAVALALYELWRLSTLGGPALLSAGLALIANIILCYLIARPVPPIGVALPSIVPPLVAAGLALLLMPDEAPSIALVAGILGPLVGADLLHLREVESIDAGVVSIGGAGTFDAIMLSGVIAAYLG